MDKSNVTVSDRQYRNDSMSVKAKGHIKGNLRFYSQSVAFTKSRTLY